MSLRRVYSRMLRLYPSDYQALFAAEMLTVFDEAVEGRSGALVRLVVRELSGLLSGAGRERLASLAHGLRHSNSYITGRGLPDRLLMRPAGVGWESFYGGPVARGKGDPAREMRANWEPEQAGSLRPQGCLNARQRFEGGSSLRRLLLFMLGDSCKCSARNQTDADCAALQTSEIEMRVNSVRSG